MQSLVIIAGAGLRPGPLGTRLPESWRPYVLVGGAPADLKLQGPRMEWFVHLSEMSNARMAEQDYFDNEDLDPEFRASLGGRSYLLLSFNDYRVLRELLPHLLRGLPGSLEESWIDNDRGSVIRADRFLAKLEVNPAWDWRLED